MHLSQHCQTRMQQRGVRMDVVRTLLDHADRSVFVGAGRMSCFLSSKEAARLRREGLLNAEAVERVCGLALVVDPDTGIVVTVLHAARRHGRHYRRQGRTWSARRDTTAHHIVREH